MSGIQVHPHDILDEGMEQILGLIGKMNEIKYIFPQVNTIFERNPYPTGDLPHNPVHTFVQGMGTFHANIDTKSLYPKLYQKVDSIIDMGKDPLLEIKSSVEEDYKIIPWLNLLNGEFSGNVERNGVVDYRDRLVNKWLCPNGIDVIPMWVQVFKGLRDKYGYEYYMVDRIRYPDWAGESVDPSNLLSCFCEQCCSKMKAEGINVDELKGEIHLLASAFKNRKYHSVIDALEKGKWFNAWINFRQKSVSEFIEKLAELLPWIRFWLDLWPPSYAWFLGQDYNRLTKSFNVLKHFPYHKLGGGADVQGFIEYFAQNEKEQEELFQVFLTFFNLKYPISYTEFKQDGYPLAFINNENVLVKQLSQPDTLIYSGIQMWNTNEKELTEAIFQARKSDIAGLLYYCYGWAERSFFDVVGKIKNE